MDIKQLPIKQVKCTHSGQYHAYGDTFREYEIYLEGDTDTESILSFCFSDISKRKVQSKDEWKKNIGNMERYFSGYYELQKTSYGYKYIVCLPYTD